jgi:MFS family permease
MSRGLKALYISSFLFNLAVAMAVLTVTLNAIRLGASPLQLGIIGMVWPAIFSVSALIAGPFSDRIPRWILPVAGSAIASIAYIMVYFANSPLHLMLIGLPAGIGLSCVWPPIEAWIADLSSPQNIRRNVGYFNLSWSIGAAPGPLIAGMAFRAGVGLPLTIVIGLIVVSALIVVIWARKAVPDHYEEVVAEDGELSRGFLYLAWIANVATYFTIGVMRSLFPKLGEQIGMGTPSIGGLLSLITFSQVVTFAILAKTSRWHYRLVPIFTSQAILLFSSLMVYSLSGVGELAPIMVLIGGCTGITYYSSIYYSLNTSGSRGARSGIHEALIGVGIVLGPLTGGIVAQYWGLRAPYLLAAGAIVVGMAATAIFGLKLRAIRNGLAHEQVESATFKESDVQEGP